jgi:hypothetical protein
VLSAAALARDWCCELITIGASVIQRFDLSLIRSSFSIHQQPLYLVLLSVENSSLISYWRKSCRSLKRRSDRLRQPVCRTVSLCELFFGRSYFFGLECYRMFIKKFCWQPSNPSYGWRNRSERCSLKKLHMVRFSPQFAASQGYCA